MATAPDDHIEIEWQFEVADTAAAIRWFEASRVPGFTVVPGPRVRIEDTYYDTADWLLHGAGYTCRVRTKAGGREFTLKSMAEASGGVRSRREINEPLTAGSIDAMASADGPAGQIIRAVTDKRPLQAIFSLKTTRRLFALADSGGTIAEIAVDEVVIPVQSGTPVRLARVEVEVEERSVERVRRFVDVAAANLGLVPAETSKFQAALAATGLSPEAGTGQQAPAASSRLPPPEP